MSMYEYPYRESHRVSRPITPSPLRALLLLVPLLLLLIPAGLLVWHYWPVGGAGLNPTAQLRDVDSRGPLYKSEMDLIALYEKALPSVVHINNLTDRSDGFSLNVQRVPRGSGSGFIWDKDGHIVTNFHVVQGASAVQVILSDRSTYEAKTVWVYPDKDLAVLRINAPKDKLVPIPLGSSHDLKVGQAAIVIGNPFGLDGTLTSGIVSALGREIESVTERPIQNVIQTSAPINPGNSGGPLLDSDGRLIGVTTAILSPSGTFAGIGFAIPVDEVNTVVTQLIQKGKIERPLMGVQMAESKQFNAPDGALVTKVIPDSPAAKAGLRATRQTRAGDIVLGDIIVALDQQPVQSTKDVFNFLERHKPGDAVTVTVLREGQRKDIQLTLDAAS
jgi:S1-C subfamily serine protease